MQAQILCARNQSEKGKQTNRNKPYFKRCCAAPFPSCTLCQPVFLYTLSSTKTYLTCNLAQSDHNQNNVQIKVILKLNFFFRTFCSFSLQFFSSFFFFHLYFSSLFQHLDQTGQKLEEYLPCCSLSAFRFHSFMFAFVCCQPFRSVFLLRQFEIENFTNFQRLAACLQSMDCCCRCYCLRALCFVPLFSKCNIIYVCRKCRATVCNIFFTQKYTVYVK